MGNTLLHFHHGKSDIEKDMNGLVYLKNYLNEFNLNITISEIYEGFYKCWMKGIEDRKITYKEYPIESFLNRFLKNYDLNLSIKHCIEAVNLFYTDYRENLYFEKDIEQTLNMLKNNGYKLGVISNTCYYDEVMIECFKRANINNLIDSFTFSYSLRIGKPSNEIFMKALNKMNVTPKEAVMVGDSLIKDIEPALKLGMKTILLENTENNNQSDIIPYKRISAIKELINFM